MAYQALYRKWRPSDFNDVYGQGHITHTLKTEVETGHISHAYLFTGSRGTGKTSCAKILSKAVNCLHPVDGNPCNECEICKGIDSGSIMDVVEIDAASNNGVDNIRDIREEVNFTPAFTKYRVYIIDEVHMLSISAFNALLKTLEEPPAHVIFILATTDVQKLPPTVLSRCQRFDFKRITPDDIIARLKYVAQNENITITDDAASLIANVADGGMRDALSLMDRAISISDNITSETVSSAAGMAGTNSLFEFSDYIAKEDFTSALLLVTKLHTEACDISNICQGLLSHFRNLMVSKTVQNCNGLIICSADELKKYKERADQYTITKILECIDILTKTADVIKYASNKKIHLESAVIKMCGVKNTDKGTQFYPAAEERIIALEQQLQQILENGIAPANSSLVPKTGNEPQAAASTEKKTHIIEGGKSDKPLVDGAFGLWPEVQEAVLNYDPPLYGVLANTTALIRDNKLVIVTDNSTLKAFIIENERYKSLYKAIEEVTGTKIKVSVKCTATEPKAPSLNPLQSIISKVDEFNNGNNN